MTLSATEANYEAAKADPVAAVILDGLHKQDAATYHGNSGDTGGLGGLALDVAATVREIAGREERHRLADLLDGHKAQLTDFAADKERLMEAVIFLLRLDKP